jgi:chromosome segregation ATPase
MADLLKIKQVDGLGADLSELVSADGSLATKISTDISDANSSLDTRVSDAEDYAATDSANLSSEIAATNSEVGSINLKQVSQDSRADDIESDATSLETRVSNEESARASGDSSVVALLSAEIADTNADVTSLDSYILGVSADLSNEIADTNDDVTSLEGALSTEISATGSEVTSLNARVSGDEADLSNAIVAYESADTSLTTRVSTEEVNRAAAVSTEASTRLAADNSLNLYIDNVSGALSAEIADTNDDVTSLEGALSTEISATNSDIASIEAAFVKDPLGNQRFAGSGALEYANQAGGTLARTHKAQLSSVVEGGVVANIIGVYINGLVADPAYYALSSDGVTGNTEVTFQTSYTLDTDDTIVVKFVVD